MTSTEQTMELNNKRTEKKDIDGTNNADEDKDVDEDEKTINSNRRTPSD